MPSGPGVIADDLIAEIIASIPPPIATFLLTSRVDAAQIVLQQQCCRANTLQLCDRLPAGTHGELRRSLPGVALVQVIHVTGEDSIDEALDAGAFVDALLLDSGNQSLAVKELGGTGRIHDWSISARIVAESKVPVFLAGSLTAANVSEAIAAVHPFGVDICSGVRSAGSLDEQKLRRLMDAIHQ